MSVTYHDIESAFDFVWFGEPYMNTAYFCTENETFYFKSEYGDDEELPDDLDNGNYIEIPQRIEASLGRDLAVDFTREFIPEKTDEVYAAFRKKGAYSRFKQILDNKDLIESWYKYEKTAQEAFIKGWCKENNIDTTG